MIENIIVGVVIAVTVAWAVRSLYRAFAGSAGGCACGKGACGNQTFRAPAKRESPDDRTPSLCDLSDRIL